MNTKYRIEFVSFYERSKIEKHLEEMAKKGWMIEKILNHIWKYKKIKGQELKFSIVYFPEISQFSNENLEEYEIFKDFCLHTNWKLATSMGQMQIFYNENLDATPIETDVRIEVENISKSIKKTYIPSIVLMLIMSIIVCVYFIGLINYDIVYILSMDYVVFMLVTFIGVFIISLMELIMYISWDKKAKVLAEHGEFLESHSRVSIQKFVTFIILLNTVFFIINAFLRSDYILKISLILGFLQVGLVLFIANKIKNWAKNRNMRKS